MASITRPRLGSRAISDMHPLMSPACKEGDLGQGTQATSGGAKVTSGGRTALGGIAPLSPFLPLPPAPSSEEVNRQCAQDKNLLSVHNHHARSASGSNVDGETAVKMGRGPSNAAHMIRSYSMPVATQLDYEAQREAIERRYQWQNSQNASKRWNNHLTKSPLLVGENNAMTSSQSSMGVVKGKQQLQDSDSIRSALQQPWTSRKPAKVSPRLQPRSPLSIITVNEHYSKQGSDSINEFELGSGSDEAEVATPRAISPMAEYFGKIDTTPRLDNLADFIHPSHFQPPSSLSL